VNCWLCPSQCCRLNIGPLTYLTPELEDKNDVIAEAAWQEKFNEPMPPDYPMNRIRKIMRTEEGKRRVAEAFGVALHKEAARSLKEKEND